MNGRGPAPSQVREWPAVSIVIPCRNEHRYVEPCIRSLLCQEPPEGGFELIVADGMSTDGTRDLLRGMEQASHLLRVIDNPGLTVSTALNRAIAVAKGRIVIRADVHTEYATDYIRQCVRVLDDSGADNVGGPWVAVGEGYIDSAIAAVFHSSFGSGGARAHDSSYAGPVDTVYLGCWRRECFDRIGGFDEALVRNQDDEFNLRLTRAGGLVWQSPLIRSRYHPRASLRRLFQQYVQYGYWKVPVIRKHRLPASWRHLVPALFVFTTLVLSIASLGSWPALLALGVLMGSYLTCTLAASVITALRCDLTLLPVMPLVFACFHVGYGYGFLRGIVDFAILRRAPATQMSLITRETETGPGLGKRTGESCERRL